MTAPVLAIDFGTSNSAVAIVENGVLRRIPLEDANDTLPTAVFFPADRGAMLIGSEASEALIEGDEGRYMRALKSVLGTTLFHEARPIMGKRRTLAEVVTAFLVEVKKRAEAATGHTFTRVLSGRPVHFHTNDADRDAQAEADLRACYIAAGFTEVDFLFEPEAAAWATHSLGKAGETGLIVDIGGGTSDFSVFRVEGGKVDILASHGFRLGGTDFDHAVSMAHAMPLLGEGGELTRTLGDGLLPMPKAIFVDLSTWAKIPFLYTKDTELLVDDLAKHAVEPEKVARLVKVIKDQLGHELAFAVEKGKIGANGGEKSDIRMGFVERDLAAAVSPSSLSASLAGYADSLREAMYQTLFMAGVSPAQIGTVVLVGGSSLMRMVSDEARAVCPMARIQRSEAFTAVVDGLALASA